MTIRSIMESVFKGRQNPLSERECIRALSELDESIYEDIILRHEGAQAYMRSAREHRAFPYTADTQQLIAPLRFAKLYEHYLRLETDLRLEEPARYVNDLQLFESEYLRFRAWYHETHRPLQRGMVKVAPQYTRRETYAEPFERV